jgi:hypothetical protein
VSSDDPALGTGGGSPPPVTPSPAPTDLARADEDDRPVAALNPFQAQPRSQRMASSAAVLVTIGLHAAAAVALALNPGLAK